MSTPITIKEYNKQALININQSLEFSDWEKKPIKQTMRYEDYSQIALNLNIIFDAIETIGFAGSKEDLATCAGLAQIGKQLVPLSEMDFLDKLLLKKEEYNGKKIQFTPLDK